jgi:hypothetical protein
VPRTDIARAANARIVPVVEYGVDPRGWGMFSAVTAAAHRGLSGARKVIHPNPEFTGLAPSKQNFVGVAPLGLGGGRPVVNRNAQLDGARSDNGLDDPALRVFAARMRRRR